MFCLLSYHKLIKNCILWLRDNFTWRDEEKNPPKISRDLKKIDQFSKLPRKSVGRVGGGLDWNSKEV